MEWNVFITCINNFYLEEISPKNQKFSNIIKLKENFKVELMVSN